MPFVAKAWKNIGPLFEQIKHHPFNQKMAQGVLEPQYFRYFLHQDIFYLKNAASITNELSKKNSPFSNVFSQFSQCFSAFEMKIHISYLKDNSLGCPPPAVSDVCNRYIQHLERSTSLSEQVSLASFLPCFLIYKELGHHLNNTLTLPNPYTPWIASYGSERFCAITDNAVACIDKEASALSMCEYRKMLTGFTISACYEQQLWDNACGIKLSNEVILKTLRRDFDRMLDHGEKYSR